MNKIPDEILNKIVPLLGTMPDYALAERFAVSQSFVCLQRQRRGITAWGNVNTHYTRWGKSRPVLDCPTDLVPLLGKVTDKEIATKADVSRPTARRWRLDNGVAPFRKHTTHTASPPWIDQVGKDTDARVAEANGVILSTVRRWRTLMGVPPFDRWTNATRPAPVSMQAQLNALKEHVTRLEERVAVLEQVVRRYTDVESA